MTAGRVIRWRWVLSLALLLPVLLVLATVPALAHGGGTPQLTNADAGPYWVSLWTQPDPLRVGKAHVTVAVSEPGDAYASGREAGAAVLGADVQIQLVPHEAQGQPLVAHASHESAANKLLYEADLALPSAGQWQVSITIEGPAGQGKTGFDISVQPAAQGFNWTWGLVLAPAAVAAVWIWQRFRIDTMDTVNTDSVSEQR